MEETSNKAAPLVRLNRLPATLGIRAQVYEKLEYLNTGAPGYGPNALPDFSLL